MPVEIACPSNAVEAVPSVGETGLRPATLAVCAIGCGLSVANIYYAQPLLAAMAHDFEIPPAAIGLIVTLTQIGYALGLILVVPLGDLIDPRKLAVAQAASSAVALTIVAASQSAAVMFPAMVMVGLLSVIVQVLVAYAAALAEPARRGQAIGTVTSGIVIGILSARVVAGLLSDLGGWRAVYMVSACLSAVLALALAHLLPRRGSASFAGSYFAVVRSIPRLFIEDPVLRLRGMLALLIFATFSTFWTALVLPLSASPFSFSHSQIGLFGIVGVAGALAAAKAGSMADRGLGHRTTTLGLALLLAAWAPIALLPVSMAALIGGVLALDLAVQAVHVTNQSVIVSRYPQARSRLVGGYMAFYSVGSGIGGPAATITYALAGWGGVCGVGALFSGIALCLWFCASDDSIASTRKT
ncbi:MFS transporter [Methylobacterium radiodurans]|uniref:MFS transporter n=1 Tax=Methylobacterium radiodurans TaxID=2202828 RepID=A0A2U8VQC7_9HYPH|nr:MFS transporter [Methylobacterium radiodurans]AWN35857.1 MFS transporter [Methylobacterium radiodurans]